MLEYAALGLVYCATCHKALPGRILPGQILPGRILPGQIARGRITQGRIMTRTNYDQDEL